MDSHRIEQELSHSPSLASKLILVVGKGGVGKSTVAELCARIIASKNKKVLLCKIEDEEVKNETKSQKTTNPYKDLPNLSLARLHSKECFEEYIRLKLRVRTLADLLLNSKVIQYFEKAAPGVRELVLLGKLWYEIKNYDHVIVDMPSTGYALTMIHTPFNFSRLFPTGPIAADMEAMLETFGDPKETAFLTVCLPEEMPIQESIELQENLRNLIPSNPVQLVMNRVLKSTAEIEALWQTRAEQEALDHSIAWKAFAHVKHRADKQKEHLLALKKTGLFKDWITLHES